MREFMVSVRASTSKVSSRLLPTLHIYRKPFRQRYPTASDAMLGPGNDAEGFRSVRDYETAEAQIDVDGGKSSIRLPDNSKLIVAQGRFDGVELHAVNNLLTADELDLVRSPADSLALISLLPNKEVSLGDKWVIPTWAIQLLTGLDAVTKGGTHLFTRVCRKRTRKGEVERSD